MRRKRRSNKKVFLLIGVVLVLGIIAFALVKLDIFKGSNDNLDNPNNSSEVEETPVVEEVKKLQIVDESKNTRPFAVMINNISTARPLQSGLQDAFIIYEIIVEGGITRYMALFTEESTTERIGSIRSSRHYYLDYALENDAIYVHHGQSPQAQSDFSALGIDRIVVDNGNTGFRDTSLKVASEHTLFTSIEKLKNGIGNKRTERNKDLLLNYSLDELDLSELDNAKIANNVSIKYSNSTTSEYTYDADTKTYFRSVNGTPHVDYVTKKQYTFKNIITYQVENYTLNDAENKGRQDIKNVGSGTGYYITNGYAIPIKWSKKSRKDETIYTLENGEELKVNDGNTFIQIQPKGLALNITE